LERINKICETSCCGPLGPYSLIDSDTPATSRCCNACAINSNAQALRCCSQLASRLL